MLFHNSFYIILIDPDCILPLFFLFCAEADPPLYMYAAIFFPLVFTGLATILLIYFRRCVEDFLISFCHSRLSCVEIFFWRKRDVIFPKIPEPRDLLSSIPDNNFMVSFSSISWFTWTSVGYLSFREAKPRRQELCVSNPLYQIISDIFQSKILRPFFFFQCKHDSLYANSKEQFCKISLVTEPICINVKPLKHPLLWSQLKLNTSSCTWSLDTV